ncbi:MAG TPA: M28 family peptidase [Candidatus Tumulicola sp.]|jgi:N-acetylated-alpha-linked acidic dipeptidase
MTVRRVIIAAFAALLTTGFTGRGFVPDRIASETQDEATIAASPNEAAARADELALASYVHRMGTPGDERTANYVRDQLAKAGFDAKIVTYVVPIAWPVEQRLTLYAGSSRAHDVSLYEPAIASDPYSQNHAAIGIPYSGYSNDGDATGPVVYANHAVAADFDALAAAGVSVKGAIVVARSGGGALTAKAFEAAKRGAAAVLVFNDPLTGGYFMGDTYPKGPWRSTGAATRNTMTFTNDPGDPTAIGIPVPGAPHKPFSAIALPSIPEAPITGDVARELLQPLGGATVPADWHPGFAFAQHFGGDVRARFVLRSRRFFGPIWDVIGTLRGTTDQTVVVGSHRDAWTYGSVDPISGTVDLLQLARAFGKLHATGWQPRRTVIIGSWDGEELNLFGSDIWVRQNEADLRARCVAYVNTDEVAYGPFFGAAATPDLADMLRDTTTAVTAPGSLSLLDTYWRAQDPRREVDPIGGGSDHEPFVYHENIPALAGAYAGPFGTYHSAYDDPASLAIFDPGMHRAAAAARFTSMAVLRLANADYPDLRLAAVATTLRERLDAFAKGKGDEARRAQIVQTLTPASDAFVTAATALDARADAAISAGNVAAAGLIYAHLRASEDAFFQPNSSKWMRTMLYSVSGYAGGVLPSLDDALKPDGDAAVATLQAAFQAAAQAASTK